MGRRRALLFGLVLVACVGCDQASKRLAEQALDGAQGFSVAQVLHLHLELAHNPGAFLSVGADLPEPVRRVVFGGLLPLALLAVCVLVWRSARPSAVTALALGLLAGGGLGNWIDRIAQGGTVTDFLRLELGPLRTGVFNLADLAILAGVGLILAVRPAADAADLAHAGGDRGAPGGGGGAAP